MKKSFLKALKIFKYLFILFSIAYWIGIVIDDWVFVQKYWDTNALQYIGIWLAYYIVFTLGFSFYYWGIATIIIVIYHQFIKRIMRKKDEEKE